MDEDKQFAFALEKEKIKFLHAAGSVLEFEMTFREHNERAIQNGKTGYFISKDEHECTVDLYRSIHAALISTHSNITNAMRQMEFQNRLLEMALQEEILKSIKQSSAA